MFLAIQEVVSINPVEPRRRGVRGKGAALRSHRQSATSVRNPLRTQDSAALVRIHPAVWSWANHLMDSSPFSGTWWTAKLQTTSLQLQTENFKLPTSVTGPVSSPRLYKYAKLSGLSLSQGFLSPRIKIHQSINQSKKGENWCANHCMISCKIE